MQQIDIDLVNGRAVVDKIKVDLLMAGFQTTCTLNAAETIEPNSTKMVLVNQPLSEKSIAENPAVHLYNTEEGFLEEHDLSVIEGIYNNGTNIIIPIQNPCPYKVTIPKGAPIAYGASLEQTNDGLYANELIEVTENAEHQRLFKEHLEVRKRKFSPETSDVYKTVSTGDALTTDQQQHIELLLKDNREVFSTEEADIGLIKSAMFGIPWKDETAEVYLKPRPTQPAYKKRAREIMTRWEDMGVIEPTSSRHNVPLFFISKKGGDQIRPILDCRAINEETVNNHYPIPHLRDLIYDVSEMIGTNAEKSLFISSTDICAAYNQLKIKNEDRHKCSFSWENRQYQAARCIFGLKTAPSAFCQYMATLTKGLKNVYVLLDDVIILSTSFDEHLKTIQELFKRCISEGLTLKPSKTHLCMDQIEYLGFKITKEGIEPLKHKVEPIISYPQPKTKRQLRRFLGMTNFYSKHVPRGTQILSPLYKLCGSESFKWRQEHLDSFTKYKDLMKDHVILAHRDLNKKLVLVTEASQEGITGGLHQMNDKNELEPLGFVSRALKDNETRLASRYLEFLAIIWALESFDWELQGSKVTVMTDHASLTEILKEKEHKMHQPVKIINAHARLARYDVEIIHRPNSDPAIIAMDAFSRAIPIKQEEQVDSEDEKYDRGVSNNIVETDLLNTIENNEETKFGRLKTVLRNQQPDETVTLVLKDLNYTNLELLKLQEADPIIKEKIVKKKCQKNSHGVYIQSGFQWAQPVILIPQCLARELVSYLHIRHGHVGAQKLDAAVKRHFHIKGLLNICDEVCKACEDCICCKPKPALKHPKPPAPDFAIKPWTRFFLDLCDFGRPDDNGNRYVVACMDGLSRFIDGVPIPNKQNETVSKAISTILLRHNAAGGKAVMDNGKELNGPTSRHLFETFGISISHISPYYPVGNKIERAFRELGIKAKIQQLDQNTWSRDFYTILWQMNNTPHSALGNLTPNEVLTGRPMPCPAFPDPEISEDAVTDEYSWVQFLSRWLYDIGVNLAGQQAEKMENHAKLTKNHVELELGQRVAYWSPQRKEESKKLYRAFCGEGKITKILPAGSYEITTPNLRKFIRNIKFLRVLPNNTQ